MKRVSQEERLRDLVTPATGGGKACEGAPRLQICISEASERPRIVRRREIVVIATAL